MLALSYCWEIELTVRYPEFGQERRTLAQKQNWYSIILILGKEDELLLEKKTKKKKTDDIIIIVLVVDEDGTPAAKQGWLYNSLTVDWLGRQTPVWEKNRCKSAISQLWTRTMNSCLETRLTVYYCPGVLYRGL